MNAELLRVESLAGPGFSGTSFGITPGGWLRLADGPHETCEALVDILFGLSPAHDGRVLWDGVDVAELSESGQLDLAARIGFVHSRGGLLLNLRVWENLMLPLQHHQGRIDREALEAEILEAFAAAGIGESSAARILASRTDDLPSHEILLALLMRACCTRPALIICEAAFDGMPRHACVAAMRLLDHTAARCPGLALLTIGDSTAPLVNLTSAAWPEPETLNWNPPSWHAT